MEAVFSHVKGVKSVVSGYHGGTARGATYDLVSSGVTDHAEAVRVVYDPKVVRYDQLVRILFSVIADPTLKNRQGPDVGAHYRAALIPVSDEQRAVARAYLAQMARSKAWDAPIVTRIEKRPSKFYRGGKPITRISRRKTLNHPYIRRWDAPKVAALKRLFSALYSPAFKTG